VVNNAQLAYSPEIVLRRTSVRARKGDSIASVAARYDLPAATVAGWNHASAGARLKPGQAVVLFLPVRASTAAAREGAEHARPAAPHGRAGRAAAERKAPARAERAGKSKPAAAATRQAAAPRKGASKKPRR